MCTNTIQIGIMIYCYGPANYGDLSKMPSSLSIHMQLQNNCLLLLLMVTSITFCTVPAVHDRTTDFHVI